MESDENRLNETARSLDSPFQLATQKKNQQRAGGKTLKDNTAGRALRPDTPMLNSVDRMPFSRLRTNHRVTATPTAAAKLLQSSGMSASSAAIQDGNQRNSGSDLSADMLPIVSSSNSLKFSASPFSRSLNSPFSTCEPSLFHPVKPLKTDLPPVPPPAKLTTDTRKAKKISSHQEDVHSLKLLYNHYLLWRYANAKAETAMCAQKRDAQVSQWLYYEPKVEVKGLQFLVVTFYLGTEDNDPIGKVVLFCLESILVRFCILFYVIRLRRKKVGL